MHRNDEVAGDDPVAAAEVVPAPAKHHVPLEVLDMHLELAPLVRRQPDHERDPLDDQPLVHHLHELASDDEHGEVFGVLDLVVEAQRLLGPLLMAGPQRSSP